MSGEGCHAVARSAKADDADSSLRAPTAGVLRLREPMQTTADGIGFANGSAMTHVPTVTTTDATGIRVERSRHQHCHVRVLRWIFSHAGQESVVCELALTGEDREYELRVPAAWSPTGVPVERFDDALTAFQRHAMIERQLLDEGWQLDGFESERVTVH